MNKIDLSGRNAIVTGGAQGFGLEISQRFIDSGAKVMIWDIDKKLIDSLQTKLDKHSSFFDIVDVTDFSSVSEGVNNAIRKLGKVDIFVNNAGITGPNETTWDYPIDDWRKVIEVDLNGVFYCSKSIVPHMIENNYGRIVNIASIAGKEGNPNAPAYSSAKAAVIALTKSLGKELSQYSISVNCVTPSAAKTRIFDQMTEEHIDYMLSKIPRNRFVDLDEVASLVTWLSSEECSYSTGAVFDISGGRATY
ncbi:MAG: SDR family oxidoreductase [SAR202 cluster bacterium]|nr:SDR family oxidoreductase [SAR202 cluster bacterium]|tara:strand:+ start:3811 stop:4560 length:750 start_codon:yes stop_codon:yes gene_type:complete